MATLNTEKRDPNLSSGELNKWRKSGKIPAIVYGKEIGAESKSVWINLVEFMKVYHDTGKVMEMNVDGQKQMVNAKFIDRAPMGQVQHINFHQLVKGQKTQVKVPLAADGEAKGVKAGGVFNWAHDVLWVEAVPKDIPESIHFDVEGLDIGDTWKAGDIKLPQGVTLVDEPDMVVCSVGQPQKEEPVAELVQPEEGQATPAEASPEASDEPEKQAS